MAGAYYRMQELLKTDAAVDLSPTQRLEDAIDVLGYGTVIVQLRQPVTSTGAALFIQHAPVLEESAFEDVTGGDFNLGTLGNQTITLTNTLRFLRWRITDLSGGDTTFLLDVIARDN